MSIEWRGIDHMRSGPLFRVAGNASLRVRRRAYEWLRERFGGFAGRVVLDHGATPDTISADSNCHLRWLLEDGATVWATSAEAIGHLPAVFPGLRIAAWPPNPETLGPIDLVISSSVVAHVGGRLEQVRFVQQLLTFAPRLFLTTPNRRHWLEFHTKLPLLHWLPRDRYHAALDATGLGFWKHLNLLSREELQSMLDEAAANGGASLATQWYEPRLLGCVSNLVVLATQTRPPAA
ncbi:MAG TPA: hypothetical protein VMF61_03950 [Candidatus Acidoferrales bacterium]|nr:hypothetical protein [Candidatus Acidoferrales bacterium]